MPFENACPSVNANFGSWQLAHDMVSSTESRLSKYRSQPSSAFSGEYGLSFGQKMGTSPCGTFGPSGGNGDRSWATAGRNAIARIAEMAAARRVEAGMVSNLGR